MNCKERFMAAMRGEPVDRVPVTFYAHQPNAKAHIEWVQRTGMDGIAIEPEGYYGIAGHWDAPLQTLDDLKKVRPFTKKDKYISGQVDRARKVADAIGQDHAILSMAFTPFSVIKHTLGGETRIMELYREDPVAFRGVMDVFEETTFNLLDAMKESGTLDAFFISFQNAELWRFTPEEYTELLMPYDKRLLAKSNENFSDVIVHLCSWGNEPNNVFLWKDYDYKVLNWGVYQEIDLSLAQGRKYFRPGTTVMGGFDRLEHGIMYTGTIEQIKEHTKQIIRETGKEGLILSADCSVEPWLPDASVRAIIEACEEYED